MTHLTWTFDYTRHVWYGRTIGADPGEGSVAMIAVEPSGLFAVCMGWDERRTFAVDTLASAQHFAEYHVNVLETLSRSTRTRQDPHPLDALDAWADSCIRVDFSALAPGAKGPTDAKDVK